MIDGVKLLCNLNPTNWIDNKNLSFSAWTDLGTGEVKHNNKHANTKGLHLSINDTGKGKFCNVRGSLATYYNQGENNAFDYDYTAFLTTCNQLQSELSINPENAILQGFEFGVNIELPNYVSDLYESLKSFRKHIAGVHEINGKQNGIRFDFQQYRVKIYDKGKQVTGKKNRLLRFEIAVKKMLWVKALDIKTLSDLQRPTVWHELTKILVKTWLDMVIVEKGLQYKQMTNLEQKKYLRYFDTNYWANLNRKQYSTAKNHLEKIQTIYHGKTSTKEIIQSLILDKCQLLATETGIKKGYDLTKSLDPNNTLENAKNLQRSENQKRVRFNHLDKGLIQGTNSVNYPYPKPQNKILYKNKETDTKKNDDHHQNNKPKKCKCMNCRKSLTNKKPSAKFCGLKCKNQYNGKRRTMANRKNRVQEQKHLNRILPVLDKKNLSLLVLYRSDGLQYADRLKQSEIQAPKDWQRKITKVYILNNKEAPPLELTTLRAKKLIKAITEINQNLKSWIQQQPEKQKLH